MATGEGTLGRFFGLFNRQGKPAVKPSDARPEGGNGVSIADIAGDANYSSGQFSPYSVRAVKPIEQFFGYSNVKRRMKDSFDAFTSGQVTLPILMDGPPGIGKTELFLSFAQKYKSPIVVSDQDSLSENLEDLLKNLGKVDKKYFLFFDDVNPDKVNWHHFRNNVCGVGNYPVNVLIGIATNDRFPENVTSRGNYIIIPEFTLAIAKEIGRDYLVHAGLKSPDRISAMVNGFVNTYISGYKATSTVTEISPRSFIKHMDYISASPERREALLLTSALGGGKPGDKKEWEEKLKKMKIDSRNVMSLVSPAAVTDAEFVRVYKESLARQGYAQK